MTIPKSSVEFAWISPRAATPPHRITKVQQVRDLIAAFKEGGWDTTQPALVGYEWGRDIQLLTGTHRRAAALGAKIKIPVWIWTEDAVEAAWGQDTWSDLLKIGERYPTGYPAEHQPAEHQQGSLDNATDLMLSLE